MAGQLQARAPLQRDIRGGGDRLPHHQIHSNSAQGDLPASARQPLRRPQASRTPATHRRRRRQLQGGLD